MLAQLITFFTRVFGRSGSASTHENTAQSEPVSTHSPHLSSQTALTQFLSSLKEHHASASTIKNYASDISQFLTSQPETPLTKLFSTASLDAFFQTQIEKGLKDSSIQRKLASIKQFARWLEGQGHLHKSMICDSLRVDPPNASRQTSSLSPVQKIFWFTGLKKFSTLPPRTSRAKSLSWLNALQLFALLVFCAFLALFGYRQFFSDATPSQAFPDAPVRPSRILSFQGRLTDTARNPITTAANVTFRLFNQSSAGTELWSSGICSIDPDQDGIFTTILGSSCGTELSAEVFSEHSQVWLEITVGSETLTPRQRIATVAYALNAETLQGYPINATQSATRNTVAVMNEYGEILLGEINPRIAAVGGAFTLEGQSLILQTAPSSNGDITLAPDGDGNTIISSDLDISGYATASASLAVGTYSAPSGIGNAVFSGNVGIGNNTPNHKLDIDGSINLSYAGAMMFGGGANDLRIRENWGIEIGGDVSRPVQILNTSLAVGYDKNSSGNWGSGNMYVAGNVGIGDLTPASALTVGNGDLFQVNSSGAITAATGITSSGAITFSTLNTAGGVVYTNSSGQMLVSAQGSAGQCLTSNGSGAPTWGSCGAGGSSNWQIASGVISPGNSTLDFAVGGTATASAKFAVLNTNAGTPTASVSAGVNGATYITADGTLGTTARSSLTLGNSSAYNTTGNILLHPNGVGNVGIGTTTPSQPLDVAGGIRLGATGVNNILNTSAAGGAPSGSLYWGNGELLTTSSLASFGVTSVTGTTNQVSASPTTGAVTISLPSDLRAPGTLNAVTSIATGIGAGTVRIDANGNLTSIGTIQASGNITSSGGVISIQGAGDNYFVGNVGIGDSSPTALLTVGNGDLFQINSSGAITAVKGVANTGAITSTGGAISLNASSNFTTSINTGTSTGAVAIGGGSGTVAIDSSSWDIATTGVASGFTGITSSGDITFSSLTANRFVKTTTGGLLTTSQYVDLSTDITGVLGLANGGTNKNLTAVAGGVLYTDADSMEVTAQGSTGQCLTSNGSGVPTWGNCAMTSEVLWQTTNGAVALKNISQDLLVGGTATASAKFAVLNMDSGTPTASVSAGVSGALSLSANGTLQTTQNNTLTLGGTTTGNIVLSPNNGSGSIQANGSIIANNGITRSGGDLALSTTNSGDITLTPAVSAGLVNVLTGNLKVGNGAPSIASMNGEDAYIEGELEVDGTAYFDNGVITSSIDSLTGAVQISADDNVTINMTTNPSTSLLHVLGGSIKIGDGTPTLSLNGEDLYVEGTIEADGVVRFDSSLTVSTLNTAGGVIYANSSGQLLVSTQGSTGQCLTSNGAGAPTWGSCGAGGSSNWQIASGVISPGNSTLDFAVGGTATASAKFHVNAVTGDLSSDGAAVMINDDLQIKGGDILGNLGETRITIDDSTDKSLISGALDITGILRSGSTYQFQVDGSGNITTSGNIALNGGSLTTTATTANLFNTTATTLNIGGAATAISLGSATGTTTINHGLIANGATVFNELSNDVDFRVESNDNQHMLFVDAGNNRVGIGNSAPSAALEISSPTSNITTLILRAANITNQPAFSLLDIPSSTDTNSGKAFEIKVNGEGYGRGMFYSDGSYGIGGGSALRDVFLSRSTTNTLKISSDRGTGAADFVVTDQVGIGSSTVTSGFNLAVTGATSLAGNTTIGVSGGGNTHTMNGIFYYDNGSAATPSIRFDSANSGFFYSTGQRVSVAINGTETLQFANPGIRLMPEKADGIACNSGNEGIIAYDRDNAQAGLVYFCRQTSTGTYEWRSVTNASGNPDLAENVRVNDSSISAGDIVGVSADTVNDPDEYYQFSAKKAQQSSSHRGLLGIISSKPGILLGEKAPSVIGEDTTDPWIKPLALAGRVPTKVILDGPIVKGDRIGVSNVAGYGEKVTSAGYVVGSSLTDVDPTTAQCTNVTGVEAINWNTANFDSCFRLPDGKIARKIMVMINNEYYMGDIALSEDGQLASNYDIQSVSSNSESVYQIIEKSTQTLIAKVSTFAHIVTAQITAGLVRTQELIATVGSFSTAVESPSVRTALISPITDDDSLTLVIGNTQGDSGSLTIRNQNDDTLLSIDTAGNATLSGSLSTQSHRSQLLEAKKAEIAQIEVETATISGSLYLSNGQTIEAMLADNAQFLATYSATPSAIVTTSYDNFLSQLTGTADATVATLLTTLKNEKNIELTPDDIVVNADGVFIHSYLGVSGHTDLNTVSVAGTLSIGNTLHFTHNSISALGQSLEIQPSGVGRISLLAGLLELNDEGQVFVNGDLRVTGKLAANEISTNSLTPGSIGNDLQIQLATRSAVLGETTRSRLTILDEDARAVAAITASGSARFSELTTKEIILEQNSDATEGSVGQGSIAEGATEIFITNTLVGDDALIYITPTSDTNNQVLYLKSQEICSSESDACQKGFTVGLNAPAVSDISFNYWIVRTKHSMNTP